MNIYIKRVFIMSLILGQLWPSSVVQADAMCHEFSSEHIISAIQLSPEIPRQLSREGDQVIHEEQVVVPFGPGVGVRLTGSSDGLESLVVDDFLEIQVQTTDGTWRHDFRNESHTAIVPIEPQGLGSVFSGLTGDIDVWYQARDLMEPEYRSSEVWLVVWQKCLPTPTQTNTPTVTSTTTSTATPTATLTPTATNTPVPPTSTPTATWTPTFAATPEPTATSTATVVMVPVEPDIADPVSSEPLLPWPWRSLFIASLSLLAGLGVAIWLLEAQRRRPRGIIEVYLAESGEFVARYVLQQLGKSVLTVGANGDIWLPELTVSTPIARIYTRREDGERMTMWDLLSEKDPSQVLQTIEVYDGLRRTVHPYMLTYQQQVEETSSPPLEQEEIYG